METFRHAVDILNWRANWAAARSQKKAELISLPELLALSNSVLWAFYLRLSDTRSSLKSKIIFVLRVLSQPAASVAWFFYLYHSCLRDTVFGHVSLLDAIHRPFYDRQLGVFERLSLLRNHFHLSQQYLGTEALTHLMEGKTLPLASFQGKNQQEYKISLLSHPAYQREGGLTLGLFHNELMLQSLTFSIDQRPAGLLLRVGGTQSCQQNSKEQIKEATKGLYGIQPRLLLIEALRYIAQELQCVTIECIAKKNHIYEALRYRFSKKIRAEYDQLWSLAGGIPHFNGNFLLPMFSEEKPLSERPANKRAEYRGRDTIKLAMREQISSLLLNKFTLSHQGKLALAA